MKEHTLYALKSRYTSSVKYDAKHMFSYLDFRCYFEANGQNHIHFGMIFSHFQITLQQAGICISMYIPRDLAESKRKCSSSRQSNPEVNHRTHLKDSSVS